MKMRPFPPATVLATVVIACSLATPIVSAGSEPVIGREVAVPRHLQDGEEFTTPLHALLAHGRLLFNANWTIQEGAGRPLSKGTGAPLVDPSSPLLFPNNFNRVSGPDANSCAGCHNSPAAGGNGDIVANVFVLGQRFDHATFNPLDLVPTRGAIDEGGMQALLDSIGNPRSTPGMFGSGYIEMLARQITADLRAIRDSIPPGSSAELNSKGISFGTLARDPAGNWATSAVEGMVAPSLATAGPDDPPGLEIRPFHQASNVVSLRQFTNNAFNHHHGMQSAERFGDGLDPDDDGFADELTRADITATVLFQATLPVPGRVIPDHPKVEQAVLKGEQLLSTVGCSTCHSPSLPLADRGWIFTEPSPFNPLGNETPATSEVISVDLSRHTLPGPRLTPRGNRIDVPAYTDLKVHDISSGSTDPNNEALNMNAPAGSDEFFAGNSRYITRRLWDCGNKPNYFHHGKFTTIREAIANHFGEADESRSAFDALPEADRNCVIEFLKSLQILAPGTKARIVDEHGHPRNWPPRHRARPTEHPDHASGRNDTPPRRWGRATPGRR